MRWPVGVNWRFIAGESRAGLIVLLALWSVTAASSPPAAANHEVFGVCHATGSQTNPFVYISPDMSSGHINTDESPAGPSHANDRPATAAEFAARTCFTDQPPTNTPTNTSVPPSNTPTNTPTATSTGTVTATSTATNTSTATSTGTVTATSTGTVTPTGTATATATGTADPTNTPKADSTSTSTSVPVSVLPDTGAGDSPSPAFAWWTLIVLAILLAGGGLVIARRPATTL